MGASGDCSHGTRAPTACASRMSRVRVARSRVRPMVRLYIAHVGVDPPGVTAPTVVADWTVGCTVARSHGTRAPTPRANCMSRGCLARSRVRPMVRMYIAHVGVDPPGVTAAGRRCGLDGGLHRGSFAWHPGPNPTRKSHEPCVSGPTYGADVHSPRGGRPTWSDCSRPSLRIGRWLAPWLDRMGPGPQPHAQTA